MTTPPEEDYRLPASVLPRRYELRLAPDLKAAAFTGEEAVLLDVLEATARIEMNAVELEVGGATLAPGWPGEAAPGPSVGLEVALDPERERVVFTSPSVIAAGRYTLVCSFSGVLNDKLCGFYRSTFVDTEGVEQTIATTQFEETDARRAFPCFDEPDKKAVFSVTLDVASDLLAVSNAREVARQDLGGGRVRVRFADTVVMSSYLVAFVVGPLVATPPVDVDGVALRVVHAPGKGHLTGAAIDSARHALGFYRAYFDLPYPGDKLDLVAVPDFAAGAMENLGCVTFREAILLSDPENTARAELERLAEVVEHELAHMWFGDLVTMRWWNGIWLNEAFATFMALRCMDDYRPEWQCFVGFSRDKSAALAIDGLHATRPVEFPVRHPDEAAAMFDVLTYEKGAAVLWMIERYLGEETFREGVRRYLAEHAYANTETTDLWDALEEAASEPIRAVMDSFIFQGGYPLVSVVAEDGGCRLTQRPFSYLPAPPEAVETSAIGQKWLVPVLAGRPGADRPANRLILAEPPAHLEAEGPQVVNAGGSGFFRVAYDDAMLSGLVSQLFSLSPSERYSLVSDHLALSLAEPESLPSFVSLVGRLPDEEDPYVWSVVIGALGLLDQCAVGPDRTAVMHYVRGLLAPVLARVGWGPSPGEDENTPLLRSSLVSALGTIGEDGAVIARAREAFERDHEREQPIDPDLAAAVLAVVAAHAGPAEFEAIEERYRHPDNPMDEIRHLNCLAALTDPELAATVHRQCLGEIRSQNAPYLLGAMLRNRAIGVQTFDFIEAHFAELVERFPENSIHRMLDGISGLGLIDEHGRPLVAERVRAFVEANIEGGRRRQVTQSLERHEINLRLARATYGRLAGMLAPVG